MISVWFQQACRQKFAGLDRLFVTSVLKGTFGANVPFRRNEKQGRSHEAEDQSNKELINWKRLNSYCYDDFEKKWLGKFK